MSLVRPWEIRVKEKASFRGIIFGLADSEVLFGRRNVLHEYPLRDIPYAEDLGKKAREYTINAFFVGPNYIDDRDRFMKAIEDKDTPGTLVHPTLGIRQVIPKDCRVKFSNREGGIEYLTLTFIDAGENTYPQNVVDARANIDNAVTTTKSELEGNFNSKFNVVGQPDFVAANAKADVLSFTDMLGNIAQQGNTNNEAYSNYQNDIKDFVNDVDHNLLDVPSLSNRMVGLTTGLTDLFLAQTIDENKKLSPFLSSVKPSHPELLALNAQKKLQAYGSNFIPVQVLTESRAQEYVNQLEMVNLVKNTSLSEMVRILSLMDFDSRNDAINFRNDVNSYIDPALIYLGDLKDDAAFDAVNAIRTSMVLDVNNRAATLRNITYKQVRDQIPVIVFAYNQYDDSTKETEIVARNNVRNPLFMQNLKNIELLV